MFRRNIRSVRVKASEGKLSQLREMRVKYPFRLIRDRDKSPSPKAVDEARIFEGHFGAVPMRDGVEWLFEKDADRQRFVELYGGTVL